MRITLFGNYGSINYGDEAVLSAAIVEVRRAFPAAEIHVASKYPDFTRRVHDVFAFPRYPHLPNKPWPAQEHADQGESSSVFRKIGKSIPGAVWAKYALKRRLAKSHASKRQKALAEGGLAKHWSQHLLKTDFAILGGGEAILNDWPEAAYEYGALADACEAVGVPWAGIGMGISLPSEAGLDGIGRLLQGSRLNLYRDQFSLGQVQGRFGEPLGLLGRDLAFAEGWLSEFVAQRPETREPYISYSTGAFFNPKYRPISTEDEYERFLSLSAECLDAAIDATGLEIRSCPTNPVADQSTVQEIQERMKHGDKLFLHSPQNFQELLSTIQNARLHIGVRMHSCIFAALLQTPFVAICYSNKLVELGEQLELQDWFVPAVGTDPQQIAYLAAQHLAEFDDAQTRLSAAVARQRAALVEPLADFRRVLCQRLED